MNTPNNTDLLIKKLDAAKIINRQVAHLSAEKDMAKAMKQVLAAIGECVCAERVYVYEERGSLPSNIYEWRADSVFSRTDRFQNISAEDMSALSEAFQENECLILSDATDPASRSFPAIYNIFLRETIPTVIVAPIMIGDKLTGFIGTDCVSPEMFSLVADILLTLGSFIGITMNNNREQEHLLEEYGKLLKNYESIRDASDIRNTLVDAVGSGLFAYTLPERNILLINSEAKRLFDYPADASDFDFLAMIHNKILPEDSVSMRAATITLRKPGDHAEYIFHIQKDNGEQLSVRCISKLLSFPNGQQYILSAMSDITALEKLENSLSEERRQYREALEMNSYFSFTVDLTDGFIRQPITAHDGKKILSSSGASLPIYYDDFMEESFRRLNMSFLDPDSQKLLHRIDLIKLFCSGTTHYSGECYAADTEKYYEILILLSEAGNNSHIHANVVVSDTTDRKFREEKNRSIIDSLSSIYHCVYYCDLEDAKCDVIKMQNNKEDQLPYDGTIKGFVNTYVSEYIAPKSVSDVRNFLNIDTVDERFADTDVLSIEYLRNKIGWCRGTLIVTRRNEDGGVSCLVFAIQIIDNEKKKEHEIHLALQQAFESASSANRAKTKFFANMSHDMRTPLNAILGMTAIASTHIGDTAQVKDCLDKIDISGRHLLRLVNEVLDMSKIEAGQIHLQEETFNLRKLIDEVVVVINPQAQSRNQIFSASFHNLEHPIVMGDSQRIQQVFLNILGNSVKYTPEGGRITLSVTESFAIEDNIGQYEFVFEDNGIGMSEEFLAHLFDPFERADDARVQQIQGTGLGMPIAKSILQMMNGTISVDSKPGRGTRFTVVLRLKMQSDDAPQTDDSPKLSIQQSASPSAQSSAVGNGRRLLVAEDYDMNWEVLETLLPDYGFETERAENGQICIDKFLASDVGYYDAILMDVRMPVKNGYEATTEIRAAARKDAFLPIIAMTADAFVEDIQACRDAGMNEHISKPLDVGKLLSILKQYLR